MPKPTQHHIEKVLITGGTGFVGSNLAEALTKEGCNVRILRRKNSDLRTVRGLNIEHFIGDLLDKDSLKRAMQGCDTVFHTAALVAIWKGKKLEQEQINVVGTRNVIEAALAVGIKKLIHTSSIAAIGYQTDGQLSDENTQFNWSSTLGYKYSKHLAEVEVLKGVEQGLPAVIVNPGIIIGPRDYRFHGGKLIRDVKRGIIPFYLDGGMNIVYVDDVVFGHIQAAKIGRVGERYILGGNNVTIKESFNITQKVIGGRSPKIKAPPQLVRIIAKLFDSFGSITGIQPWVSSDLVANMGINDWFSSDKATRELGYKITPLKDAIKKTYEWYKEEGLI
jgi:dihydroflavonol-4-reductase